MRRGERGQSLVEFALLIPVIVLLIYASIYLTDITRARLKTMEAARYAAFAMNKQPLVDYLKNDNRGKFTTARDALQTETERLYGALNSARPAWAVGAAPVPGAGSSSSALDGQIAPGGVVIEATANLPVPTASLDALLATLGLNPIVSTIVSIVADAINAWFSGTLNGIGYDGNALVSATVTSTWHNHLMPGAFSSTGGVLTGGLLNFPPAQALQQVTIKEKVVVLADPWNLGDGSSVTTPGSNSMFQAQVDRMALNPAILGPIPQPAQQAISDAKSIFSALPGAPFTAKVASLNYGAGSTGDAATSGQEDVFKANAANYDGVYLFDTMPMQDGGSSPNQAAIRDRGNNFLGCPQKQADSCNYSASP